MAQNQILKRYLDAGMHFTQMTQQRAEAIVKDLVKAGEVQAEQAQTTVRDLVERSRSNTERLLEQVRGEVQKQLAVAEYVTKDVVTRMQAQIDELRSQLPGGRPAKKKAPAKKAAGQEGPRPKKAWPRRRPRRRPCRPRRRRPRRRAAKSAPDRGQPPRPASARRRAGAAGPGAEPGAGPGRHRRRTGHCRRRTGDEAGAARGARGADRAVGPGPRFVSRGGEKLDAALERVRHRRHRARCLDAGASTGGFTDCLLQRGAPRWSPSTSATASSTSACGPTRGSTCASVSTSAPSTPTHRRCGRPRRGRPVVHLAAHGGCPLVWLRPPGRRSRAPREAAVRGRAGGGGPRQGRDPRPRRAGPCSGEVASALEALGAAIMGRRAVAHHRRRRQRRAPPPRPGRGRR